MSPFKILFSPFTLGTLPLKNRIIYPSIGTNLSNKDGTVSDRAIAYYSERARGGAGLLITEASPITHAARHRPESLNCYDDSYLPGLRRLTSAIHHCGSTICLQLHHSGRLVAKWVEIKDGRVVINKEGAEGEGGFPLAPSPVPREPGAPIPKEMSLEEIHEAIDQFGSAARRAAEAGFDAVEIHGAHGYLIQQFLSPSTNKRKDAYGGTSENRGRFLMEVLKRVRKESGESFPVIVRLSVKEYTEDGYEVEEALNWAKEIERVGTSAINVTGGTTETLIKANHVVPPMSFPVAYHVPLAALVKKVVKIPVIAVGRLNPKLAEKVLIEGQADLVAIGRPLLTDPYWPAKAANGEVDRIRPCIYCNYCLWALYQQKPITCFQNASVGREEECRIHTAKKAKKVFVIGGGPGGMEAARVASMRGHHVTLLEKSRQLGGQMLLASPYPNNETLMKSIEWLVREVKREGVGIMMNTEGTEEIIQKEKPEVVIVATGALPISRFSDTGPNVLNAWEVLAGKETGKRVLIVGGGIVGIETAELLHQKGCKVTVITSRDSYNKLAVDMGPFEQSLFLKRLASSDISVILSAKVVEVGEGRVLFIKEDKEQWVEAETVVLAGGSRANNDLLRALEGKVPQLLSIGDCVEPRKAKDAIHEGFLAALSV